MAKRGGLKRQHLAASKAENSNEEEGQKSPKKRRMTGEDSTDFGNYLDTERLRGFKCPKKGEDNPHLESVSLNMAGYLKDIKQILERNFKTQEYFQSFIVKESFLLKNKQHDQEYIEKRTQLRQRAHTPKELNMLNDHHGFVFTKNKSQIIDWCKEGLCNGNAAISHLGESKLGVSLSQYVDYVGSTSLPPKEGWICIVKYLKGRVNVVPPSASPLEPQPGFECHLTKSSSHFSSSRLKENEEVALSNQIFLFEYNDDGELIPRPRHVVPYAAVHYSFELSPSATLQTRDTNDPKMNRLLLQKERMNQLHEPAKTFLNNRQHPGVPLTEVKPRPPKLGCRTTQDLLSSGSSSLFTQAGPAKPRRASKAKEKAAEPGPKRAKKEEAPAPPPEKQPEAAEPTPEPQPQAQPPPPPPQPAEGVEVPEKSERPAPNVGRLHFSGGLIVSVVRLKVGSKFQGKMDLVTYAEKVVYPVAVMSQKLCVRRFLSMSSLLTNELAGVKMSLNDEFMLADGTHFGSYYRFYLRPSTPCIIPLSNLMDFMKKREKVATVNFPMGNKTLLMFPDCDFANDIGIPPIGKSAGQSPHFLHCILLSESPRHNYYSCLKEPVVAPDLQRVDEVLASYIWADRDLPPVDEEDAQLQGSYGGVWPCVEAVTQVLAQMNEIQNKRFRHLIGKPAEGSNQLSYQALDFTREVRERVLPSSPPPSDLERISELISKKELKEVLANVELLKQQKSIESAAKSDPRISSKPASKPASPTEDLEPDNFEEEAMERIGDWKQRKKDIHCGLGNIFRCAQETPSSPPPLTDCESHAETSEEPGGRSAHQQPLMIRYSKTVFEEPPSSPPPASLDVKKECGEDAQTSAMTTQLARINAEMKEPGSGDGADAKACFGKMLNVIRNSMYENRRASKEDAEAARSPPEPGGSFDGYDIQNRAAKALRERGEEDEEEEDNVRGINDWYWEYYRKSVAKTEAAMAAEAAKQAALTVPRGWARQDCTDDINDDEIHRILEEGVEEEKPGSGSSGSPVDTPSVGSFNSPLPCNRKDLRFLRLTPQASGSTPTRNAGDPKVTPSARKNEDLRVIQLARKDDEDLKVTEPLREDENLKATEPTRKNEDQVTEPSRQDEDPKVTEPSRQDEDLKVTEPTRKNEDPKVTEPTRKNEDPKVTEPTRKNEDPKNENNKVTVEPTPKERASRAAQVLRKDRAAKMAEMLRKGREAKLLSPARPDESSKQEAASIGPHGDSPSSSMSISSAEEPEAEKEMEGSHIPVMVNRRRLRDMPSPPRNNGILPHAFPRLVAPPISLPLVPLPVAMSIPVTDLPPDQVNSRPS